MADFDLNLPGVVCDKLTFSKYVYLNKNVLSSEIFVR